MYLIDVYFVNNETDRQYTGLNWYGNPQSADSGKAPLAELNKSLTIKYERDPITIKTMTAEKNMEYPDRWIFTVETNNTPDTNGNYIVYLSKTDDNSHRVFGIKCNSDGKLIKERDLSSYTAGDQWNVYILQATSSVDADGNATLTYTRRGTPYVWTARRTTKRACSLLRSSWSAPMREI